ncbi:MAG TPA: hypothetical protein VN800_02105 [Candidatus Acidoferrales bacterium]|nr:hypothetical protein [Candidatus Acidoferrales bacterium]
MHTPRFCGLFWSAGDLLFDGSILRPNRTNCVIVGTFTLPVEAAPVPGVSRVLSFRIARAPFDA